MTLALVETEGRKAERRRLKWEQKQGRRLDGWEQYRALWDGIDFRRQLINMNDKKVRFALTIMAALNAVLLIVLTRGPVVHVLPDAVRVPLAVLLLLYGIATFYFMSHAVEALRPRPEARTADAAEWTAREQAGLARQEGRALGFFIRGSLQELTYDEERRLWSEARLSEVNAELILFNRTSSVILNRQLEQVSKVYAGLKLLVILAAVMLAILVGTGVVRGGEGDVVTAAVGLVG